MATLQDAQMHREWAAWKSLCEQLKRASAALDINEEPGLHAAIVVWGEELAHLRMTQEREVWDNAWEDAKTKYNDHVGPLPY